MHKRMRMNLHQNMLNKHVPGAILRRERGGGQPQTQGLQAGEVPPKLNPFLNFQYRAGPQTHKADTTANTTKQHLKQVPDRLDIALSLSLTPPLSLSLSLSSIRSTA